jgi:2-amino-4-hydroxy-6-hydroxymethyldihydropteridine diphosphokinase
MSTELVYIGVGSNLGDPSENVISAFESIRNIKNCKLLATSSLYRSHPMGPKEQPDYINAVVKLETSLSPYELLDELQAIEKSHGRTRSAERWSARTLDLDILLFGDRQFVDTVLQIPHMGLLERDFVLYPLYELSPDLYIPGTGPIAEVLPMCKSHGLIKLEN